MRGNLAARSIIVISGVTGLFAIAGTAPLAPAAAVREVTTGTRYVAGGDKAAGVVTLDMAATSPASARLRVTEIRQVDLPASASGKPGEMRKVLLDRPVTELGDEAKVKFDLDAGDTLAGNLRVLAEMVDGDKALSAAWSEPVIVGIRRHVDLAGDWAVSKIEPFNYASNARPKNWKPPEMKSARLPGVIVDDPWFRGWVTVSREVTWEKSGELQPRFVRLSGVADSAAVTINGTALAETRPIEEMAVLSHWIEFHSPYKGEANAQTRMLFLDLPASGPAKVALPTALPGAGSAHIDIRVRGTSGNFQPHPLPAIGGDLHLDLTAPQYVKDISFDTDKAGENRRFKFQVTLGNDGGQEFHGKLRIVYGRYDGKVAYTGNCPAYAVETKPIDLKPGASTVEILHEEKPRFDTCRATFLVTDDNDKILDGDGINFHTVTFEIRDRRDFYLNNERFIIKAQGSGGETPHKRWQFRVMGGNGFRGAGSTSAEQLNLYTSEGLLSAGGPLLASVEKCVFFNPQDTSNIYKATKGWTTALADCPGLILWEATNELHGESEDARVAMLEAFHKLDPYHRPVLATKGSGEWEAEAHDGRVKGVDIVGCQYLLSKEGVDSIAAAVTEQPIMSTEVNWNDISFSRDGLWQYWLEKGVAGSLLFDYSGNALDQPTPTVPPADNDPIGRLIKQSNRDLYQDLVATAAQQADGRVLVKFGNQMPYTLHDVTVRVRDFGKFTLPDLAPGAAVTLLLPSVQSPAAREPVVLRAEYMTHAGLPHIAILTPVVSAAPAVGTPKR